MEKLLFFVSCLLGVTAVALVSYLLLRKLCEALAGILLFAATIAVHLLNTEMHVPLLIAIAGCGVTTALVGFPLFMVEDVSRLDGEVKKLKEGAEAYKAEISALEEDINDLEEDLAEVEEELDRLKGTSEDNNNLQNQSPS